MSFAKHGWMVLSFLLSGIPLLLHAQNDTRRTCGFNLTPEQKEILYENLSAIQKANRSDTPLSTRSTAYIPLVFHIVLEEGQDTFSSEQILKQIEVLNECFNNQNIDLAKLDITFRPMLPEKGMRFCLGKKTEDGKAKTGIQQKYTDVINIGDAINPEGKNRIKYTSLGGFNAWDSRYYINIWIGNLGVGQGIGTFPNSVNEEELGIIIDPDYFGMHDPDSDYYPYHLGKTLVHEMGHYFNLLHVWGLEQSCQSDDGITDTPLQQFIYSGCPSGKQFSCGSSDMYMNFMNFTDDDCLIHFTEEQMQVMTGALALFYPDLLSADRCFDPVVDSHNPLETIDVLYFNNAKKLVLKYTNAVPENIEAKLYLSDGKLVLKRTLFNESSEEIDLNQVASGIYILFLQTENNFSTRKLVVY